MAENESSRGENSNRDLRLRSALGTTLLYTKGSGPEVDTEWANALLLADKLGNIEYRLRALWGLWASRMHGGEPALALDYANRFAEIAATKVDSTDALVGARMTGMSLQMMGQLSEARERMEMMLARYAGTARQSALMRFQVNQPVMAKTTLSQILWLQGFPNEGRRVVAEAVDEAKELGYVIPLCNALAFSACRISLLDGDFDAADRYIRILLKESERHALGFWNLWARSFEGVLLINSGSTDIGLTKLRIALDKSQEVGLGVPRTSFLCDLASGLGQSKQPAEGLSVISEALNRSERNGEFWYIAELLRVKGELLLQEGASGCQAKAEEQFHLSLGWAKRQGALGWELRSTISLARLRQKLSRGVEMRDALKTAIERFPKGSATADLRDASALLSSLS